MAARYPLWNLNWIYVFGLPSSTTGLPPVAFKSTAPPVEAAAAPIEVPAPEKEMYFGGGGGT